MSIKAGPKSGAQVVRALGRHWALVGRIWTKHFGEEADFQLGRTGSGPSNSASSPDLEPDAPSSVKVRAMYPGTTSSDPTKLGATRARLYARKPIWVRYRLPRETSRGAEIRQIQAMSARFGAALPRDSSATPDRHLEVYGVGPQFDTK